ncbi:MAG: ATP-binding protein [Deltaproteobacteria bacterium]|nr:ATP-binding protein [Deltaproteobacteria bacterium]
MLIAGARQVGKTTLVTEALKERPSLILNLAELATLPQKIDATQSFQEFEELLWREYNFKPSQNVVLVFDEAQESKKLGSWVRFFKEKWTNQKVILLGSILSRLFDEETPYPVGRVEEIILRPFTFKEYLLAVKRQGLIELMEKTTFEKPLSETQKQSLIPPYLDYLQTGGMPEVVLKTINGVELPHIAWDKLLRQYSLDVERYLGEIFRNLFMTALDRMADVTCHPVKMSQLISTHSPSYRKIPKLLEVLEKWHLVHRISAQTRHPESAGGMASKRYLFDVGLTHFFINRMGRIEWKERGDVGNLIYPKLQENFVCNELMASAPYATTSLNYYKENQNSREIDFVFFGEKEWIPIEVKSQSGFSRNSLLPMIHFLESRNLKKGVLVYNGKMKRIRHRGKDICAMPPFLVSEISRLVS